MPSLSWRVPTSGDPRMLRVAIAQVGLASVIAALLLFVAVPRDWLVLGLLGLIPLAIFMAFRRWNAYRQSLAGEDNVRLDNDGLHWLDSAGQENTFSREDVRGFHIGRHLDTLRPVPALTLHLTSGFESQPIELHAPATEEAAREILSAGWNITEHEDHSTHATDYDLAIAIYGECHDDFQEWHWEGTQYELARLFSIFTEAADELPLPPPGVKPLARIVLLSRRQPTRLRIAHSSLAHFEPGLISAPGLLLREITTRALSVLGSASASGDLKFDVALQPKNTWTFHLHVRPA